MRNKKIIVTMAGLASIGVLAIGGLTNSHAQYTGVRSITLQSDKVLQLASGKYSGVVPKDGYYVVQMRGGDGATNMSVTDKDIKTHQGGEGGYVEAIYKLNRGQTISANVGTSGSNGTGTAATQGSNADTNDAKGGKGGFSVTFGKPWQTTVTAKAGGGGGSSDFRVDGTRVAAAGGGGGAAGGSSLANGAGEGGSGGYLFANTISKSGFNGEDGYGSTNNTSLAGTGATITEAGKHGTTATSDYPVWATYAGESGSGANGGSAGVPNGTYTFTPTAGGGGGAGWFGGGGGNSAVGGNSTFASDIAKKSGGGGGGSTNAVSAAMTNIDPILTTIKQNNGPDLTSFRPSNVTAGAHLGGGKDQAGKAQIYYIGETLPGTDNVGLYSVPMSEPKGSK
ncbi:MAG: hypothetical protein LBT80_08405 [Lactobacillaceae bacterium]|jgi:hypothetical protein|nr:hypothetical protein [Lactobacillaceae bacterium]